MGFLSIGKLILVMAIVAAVSTAIFKVVGHLEDDATMASDLKAAETMRDRALADNAGLILQIGGWQERWDQMANLQADTLRVMERNNAVVERVQRIFGRHDMERLAIAKPVLIQNRVNRGTARVFELRESATGPGAYTPIGGHRPTINNPSDPTPDNDNAGSAVQDTNTGND